MVGVRRAALMHRLAVRIEREADRLARLASRDNGKLLRETGGQVEYLPVWVELTGATRDPFCMG